MLVRSKIKTFPNVHSSMISDEHYKFCFKLSTEMPNIPDKEKMNINNIKLLTEAIIRFEPQSLFLN